jgi:hypothetical protein
MGGISFCGTAYHDVLPVNGFARGALASLSGRLAPIDSCARRELGDPGNPAQESFEDTLMTYSNVFQSALSMDAVRAQAPAVFAESASEAVGSRYTFIPTSRVLTALMNAGFVPVEARQTRTRRANPMHALHAVRLRRRYETIALRDSVPEVMLWNNHSGGAAYQLRMGLFRAVCTNGLVVSKGAFPTVYVAHRGDVVDQVVTGALQVSERFDHMAAQVERMEARQLTRDEQLRFAERALEFRFPDIAKSGMQPSQLLTVRRPEDLADDLYTVMNRVQEHLIRGGLSRRAADGRLTRVRRVTSLKRDVEVNSRLWDLAAQTLAA